MSAYPSTAVKRFFIAGCPLCANNGDSRNPAFESPWGTRRNVRRLDHRSTMENGRPHDARLSSGAKLVPLSGIVLVPQDTGYENGSPMEGCADWATPPSTPGAPAVGPDRAPDWRQAGRPCSGGPGDRKSDGSRRSPRSVRDT